jgi:excisionase family DNA binding protein
VDTTGEGSRIEILNRHPAGSEMDSLMPASAPKLLVSVNQAADILSVSRDTIYRLIRAGRLKSVQMGIDRSVLRVRYSDLEELVESRAI